MGAEQFQTVVSGNTPKEAFLSAVEEARYEHGHGGYTGTIAEKDSYVVLPTPTDMTTPTDEHWEKVDDKWGPAGCYNLGNDNYLFFGWASS